MKDPAFLFYSQDFLVGTMTMSFDDKGKYITIMSLMHQQGRMTEETIRLLVGSVSDILKSKFKIDENGLWYNERLEIEIDKRRLFVETRRENGQLGGRPKKPLGKPKGYPKGKPRGKHKVNLMGNENEIINSSFEFYKNQVEKAKQFNDLMSKSYVDLCRQLCKKHNEEWVMKDILTIKSQLTLDEYSKLYAKSNNNPDLIFEKISSLQTNIDYHGKYENIYLTINKWLTPKK